jgi:tetratricopeptide (TPR) repeat protein
MHFSPFLVKVKTLKKERKFLQALKILDDILENLESINQEKRIELLNYKTRLLIILGKAEDAEKNAQLTVELAKKTSLDLKGQAWDLYYLGVLHIWNYFQVDKSINYLNQAITLFSELNGQRGLGVSESYLGLAYYFQGDFNTAKQYSEAGLNLCTEFATEEDITASKIIFGIVNLITGDLQLAESLFQEGVTLSEKSGNTHNLAWALYNLGLALFWGGKSGAVNAIQRSIRIIETYEKGITTMNIISRYLLVFILLAHKEITQAQSEVEKLGKVAEQSQFPLGKGYYHLSKGLVKLHQHELGSALDLGQKAKKALVHVTYHSGYIQVIKFIIQVQLQIYLSTKEETIKGVIEGLLIELEELTEREGIHHAYTEALIIRGLIKKAEFDIHAAKHNFNLAEILALKCGHQQLARYAQNEASQLQKQSSFLQQHMTSSPEEFEQLRIQEVISYIQGAKKLVKDNSEG